MKLNSYIFKKKLILILLLFLTLISIYFIHISELYNKNPIYNIEEYINKYPQDNVTLVTAL